MYPGLATSSFQIDHFDNTKSILSFMLGHCPQFALITGKMLCDASNSLINKLPFRVVITMFSLRRAHFLLVIYTCIHIFTMFYIKNPEIISGFSSQDLHIVPEPYGARLRLMRLR